MQDMKKFAKNMQRWARAFPEIAEETYKKYGPVLVKDIRSNYLSGQVLNRRSGELQKSIRSILKRDKDVHLLVGTSVQSKGGFGYGAYWFDRGRDFLNPPIDKRMGDLLNHMAKGIEKHFEKVVK